MIFPRTPVKFKRGNIFSGSVSLSVFASDRIKKQPYQKNKYKQVFMKMRQVASDTSDANPIYCIHARARGGIIINYKLILEKRSDSSDGSAFKGLSDLTEEICI